MGMLSKHGKVACVNCYNGQECKFDETRSFGDGWRITNNPLAWGNHEPEILILGFSKGPTQSGALARSLHSSIAYKGGRTNVAKIFHYVGLIERPDLTIVDRLISDPAGRFHFGSLIRCTVERLEKDGSWKGTGGGMLDKFLKTEFGRKVAFNCANRFLADLPSRVRLVVMMGMGSKGNYIRTCRTLFEAVRRGAWATVNEVAYADSQIVVVHTEHFASQGALLPDWLSGAAHERGRLGILARAAVQHALYR